jgi:hypothetical protein
MIIKDTIQIKIYIHKSYILKKFIYFTIIKSLLNIDQKKL